MISLKLFSLISKTIQVERQQNPYLLKLMGFLLYGAAAFFCAHSAEKPNLEPISRFGQDITQSQEVEQAADWYRIKAQLAQKIFKRL